MRNFGLGVGVGETRKARSVASNKTALSNTVGRTVGLGVGMGAYVAVLHTGRRSMEHTRTGNGQSVANG